MACICMQHAIALVLVGGARQCVGMLIQLVGGACIKLYKPFLVHFMITVVSSSAHEPS